MHHANIIGPQVRKARVTAGLTQDMLAARCGARGWDISRGTLAKIEARVRCVTDAELWMIAEAIGCQLESLYPAKRAGIREVANAAYGNNAAGRGAPKSKAPVLLTPPPADGE